MKLIRIRAAGWAIPLAVSLPDMERAMDEHKQRIDQLLTAYQSDSFLAYTLNRLAELYRPTGRFAESETLFVTRRA